MSCKPIDIAQLLSSRASSVILTWAPRVEEQHKLSQEPGGDLVPTGDLEAEVVTANGSIGWTAQRKVCVVGFAGSLACTPATGSR